MNILITGGAGFIGSNLVAELIKRRKLDNKRIKHIIVIDDLSLGKKEFIKSFIDKKKIIFYKKDLLDLNEILPIFNKHKFDLVFHLAANSDIGLGRLYSDRDLKLGTLATYNVLECMRRTEVKQIIFASTSAIYGEAIKKPTPENYGPLLPISLYGASKLACEGLITAFCHNFEMQSWIYRFGNIVGKNSTHGVILDFIRQLGKDPGKLKILGNGKQAKPYLHVSDCVDGMLYGYRHSGEEVNFYNLACLGASNVNYIAKTIIKEMKLKTVGIIYTGGERGWKGDVAQVRLDPRKLAVVGWRAKNNSNQTVARAVKEILIQQKGL